MAVVRRPTRPSNKGSKNLLATIFVVLFVGVVYIALPGEGDDPAIVEAHGVKGKLRLEAGKLKMSVEHKKEQLREALAESLGKQVSKHLPTRLREMRDKHEIVGERLKDIKDGTETVQELLYGEGPNGDEYSDKPPMQMKEITDYLTNWIHLLHDTMGQYKTANYEQIWQGYHDLTVKTLYPWDREYLKRMPERRHDGSIFLSIATYRDENCMNTLRGAYNNAANPGNLFVGLVQQNCNHDCKTGVLEGGKIDNAEPDPDCYKIYCEENPTRCKQIRPLFIEEPESLGPYAARYFASKLWDGEEWFMQIDAHMTFGKDWDVISIKGLQSAPSKKPVLSHYPPGHTIDLNAMADKPGSRLCGPIFAPSDLESQIVRLEGNGMYDKTKKDTPRFAPFTAAGYFVAHSSFLKEVPFDPFLPWIFMGEEIIMSTRLWTSGYDIFSPAQSVVGHIYVRRHKPKFWESVHRTFTMGVHNPLQMMILDRVKYQLGYPEAARDVIPLKSLLTAVEQYTMGRARPLEQYMKMVGLNVTTKEITYTEWCETGHPPPGFEEFNHLYDA